MNQKTNHKLGIIVPYRDREDQLKVFLQAIEDYIDDIDYHIIVVEQQDENDFNRGKLLNIGFIKAKALGCDYVVFHDVDMLPIEVDYSYSDKVTHLIQTLKTPVGFNRDNFDEYLGGVTLFPTSTFEAINGFSNEFYGWGFEDDNLMLRCARGGVDLNTKVISQRGRDGISLKFNGKNSFVACPNVFNSIRDFTIFTQFSIDKVEQNPKNITDISSIFSIPGYDTTLTYNSFRNFAFQFWKKDLSSMNINTNHYPEGQYNASVTFSNRSDPKVVKLWMNGRGIDQLTYDKMMDIKKEKYFYIGVGDPNREEKNNWMNGKMSTFAVFPEALDQKTLERLGNNTERSVFDISEVEPILYYDAKFIKSQELIDLSGNGNNGRCFNVYPEITNKSESINIPIPHRREGIFSGVAHVENGYTEGYWKTWQSRENQLRYYEQFYNKDYDYTKEGLNNIYYYHIDKETKGKVIHLKVALT